MNEKKIVAIYTRVSTTDQAREGHSLEEQEKRLRALCEANGYIVYKVYTDAGISGKSIENRPAYLQMIKDMKKGKFNLIISFKVDRITRSIVDFEDFFNEIKKYNCGIEFLCEKIDTSGAAGMMFARILGIFAQFERELIKERTLVGVESAVNKGHFGGKPPLGYKHKLDGSGKNKLKEWQIDEVEANIVTEIFELCASGKTYFQISKILKNKYPKIVSRVKIDKETNEEQIVYRQWNDASISKILNNKSYIGIYEHRKNLKDKDTVEIMGVVPPIISEDLFYDCQEMICRNGRNYYRSKKYLFMQKLVCPKCGRIMACNGAKNASKREYLYYKCKDCGVYIREEVIEESLIDELNNLLLISNLIKDTNYIVDSKIAERFNNSCLNHKLRFAIDEKIIKDKRELLNENELNELWKMTSYETKCEFVSKYIDSITIKEYRNRNNKITSVEISDLELKPHKVNELLEYKEKNMLDNVVGSGVYKISVSEMQREKDALDYINLLKEKYNFVVFSFSKKSEFFFNTQLFKVIHIKPKRIIEKEKLFGLFLTEKTNFLTNELENIV